MTNTQTSRLPLGVRGKSMLGLMAFRIVESDPNRIMGEMGSSSHCEAPVLHYDIIAENEAWVKCNKAWADRRATTTDIVNDNENLLDVPAKEQWELSNPQPVSTDTPMINLFRDYNALTPGSRAGFKALVSNIIAVSSSFVQPQPVTNPSVVMPTYAFNDGKVKFFTSFDDVFEIPRVIIDLARSHIHVPLTLLMPSSFEKIHTDPSCIKMRKGMILDDPKKHMFFNTKGFLTEAAYEWCWNDTITKISQKKADEASAMAICEANRVAALAACLDGSSSSNRFHPYPAVKPKFKECTLGRMFRPSMQEQISLKLSRHFVSCPLSLVEKVGDQGKFHIIRDLSYVNKEDGFSVNSLLDADKFPTEWGTAAQVTEIAAILAGTSTFNPRGSKENKSTVMQQLCEILNLPMDMMGEFH
ncbi:uncharacterized protein EDB93DRAFT_1106297 [Suillus bovinus]|uniref:uncharacterized protein n=1 Tax=Suillus bovinus TaxID=48563 RepID=UPI001B85B498|nr:uncharacterized protein EDB93DRAFT_1106297 [Suillus bovinus]KAG2138728.1 hypothetical protein EDB93DRAFT_1106297 [Suillus bovinus]